MALRLITAPTVEPISLTEAKAHLRVNHSDDDTIIGALITAATSFVDGPSGFLGRALVAQTWELVIDEFPTSEIQIPLPPLQSVVSVKYDDTAGIEQTLASTDYYVDDASEPGWIVPISTGWPSTIDAINAVRVRFIAGYDSDAASPPDLTANIPGAIKAAMLLHIGALYEHRETVVVGQVATELPWGADQLLRRFRIHLAMA